MGGKISRGNFGGLGNAGIVSYSIIGEKTSKKSLGEKILKEGKKEYI